MTILVVYGSQPSFPPTDQQAGAARVQLNGYWVDYIGAVPTDVTAFFASALTDANRVAAVKLNARRQALITAIQNNDDAGLLSAAASRYPSLSGDALKAVQDIILLLAGEIRS